MDVSYRITLNNGTIFEDCQCGYFDENVLWLYLKDASIAEVFSKFAIPESYSKVTFDIVDKYRTVRTIYSGLTSIFAILQKPTTVDVCLKGDNIIVEEEIIKEKEVDSEDATIHNPDPNES